MSDTLNARSGQQDLTKLLQDWNHGDASAGDVLFTEIYQALKAIASNRLRDVNASVQTTELVHEGFLVLSQKASIHWQDRKHFFAIAANVIRRLLVDRARASHAAKRGGANARYIPLDDVQLPACDQQIDWIEFDNVLQELESLDETLTRVMELRLIMGLTVRETADILLVSTATISRKWNFGLVWLQDRMTTPPYAQKNNTNHLLP